LIKGFDQVGEVAFEDTFEIVEGDADPVISHAVLGVVVGADFLGAHAAANRRFSLGIEFGKPSFFLAFPELATKIVQTNLTITLLIAFLGGDDGNPGGFVN